MTPTVAINMMSHVRATIKQDVFRKKGQSDDCDWACADGAGFDLVELPEAFKLGIGMGAGGKGFCTAGLRAQKRTARQLDGHLTCIAVPSYITTQVTISAGSCHRRTV